MGWAIGIDFGTSRSAGAVGTLDAARAASGTFADVLVNPLEIEGNRWIASAVLRSPDGPLVVGAAADNLAGVHPERLERTPKRSLGTPTPLLLGGEPVDPRDAAAAVLRMIVAEGRLRAGGTAPDSCVLTHPVRWADVRRQALREAAERAGLGEVTLVDEPVAAAIHYAAEHVAVGAHVGVYDLGGGTFDTAVLQRTPDGFDVIGVPGGDEHIGGEDFDHRLFRFFGDCLAETSPDVWEQMLTSDERSWKRAALDLLVQARKAKEALSSYTSTQVFVPVADRDILVNRSQFEAMILDDIERTVDLMEDTVIDAGLRIDDLAAVFLVGGSSRMPLVATLVGERFGSRVVTRDEPKGVVALGAARLAGQLLAPRRSGGAAAASPGPSPVASPDASGTLAGGTAPAPVVIPPLAPTTPLPAPGALPAPQLLATPPTPAAATSGAPAEVAVETTPAPVTILWRMPLDRVPGQLAAAGDELVFGSPDGVVRCVDVRTGTLRWQVALGAPVFAAPRIADDLVVIGAFDGRVVAVDRRDGRLRWQLGTGSPVAATPAVTGPMVLVGNDGGHLLGIDRSRGSVQWDLPVGAAVRADLASAGPNVAVTTISGQVYLVDASSGTCRWGYRLAGEPSGSPAIIGDRVIVPGRDGVVYGLRLPDGAALYGVRCTGPCATGVAMAGGSFGVVDEGGVVRIHRADTGQVITTVSLPGAAAAGLTLVPPDRAGLAVVEAGAGDLVVVDLDQRRVKCSVPTGEGNRCSPVVSGRVAMVATTFGQLYGIELPPV